MQDSTSNDYQEPAKANLRRRPEFDAKIDAIDGRLEHDLRFRTRINRLETTGSERSGNIK